MAHRPCRSRETIYARADLYILESILQTSRRIAFHTEYSSISRQIEPCVSAVKIDDLLIFHKMLIPHKVFGKWLFMFCNR